MGHFTAEVPQEKRAHDDEQAADRSDKHDLILTPVLVPSAELGGAFSESGEEGLQVELLVEAEGNQQQHKKQPKHSVSQLVIFPFEMLDANGKSLKIYTFELTVTDSGGLTDIDTVIVNVNNS